MIEIWERINLSRLGPRAAPTGTSGTSANAESGSFLLPEQEDGTVLQDI
jgi:hypothetical protein